MSTEPYRHDDDDLFDYDPSSDSSSYASYESKTTSSPTSNNEVLDDIYRQMDSLVHETGVEAVNEFRIRLTDSFYEAYYEFKNKSSTVAHVQAVHLTLDELTNGRFSKIYFLKNLEQSIFRRLSIQLLTSTLIDQTDGEGLTFKEFLAKANIQISDDYVPVYFATLYKISSHVINLERALYMTGCQDLGVTPNSLIMQEDLGPSDLSRAYSSTSEFKQSVFDSVCSQTIQSDNFSQVFSSIFTSDFTQRFKTI